MNAIDTKLKSRDEKYNTMKSSNSGNFSQNQNPID